MSTFFSISKCILDFMLIYWFSAQFFETRIKKSKLISASIIIILATSLHLINQLNDPKLNTAAGILLVVVLNVILFKGNMFAQLLCSVVEVLFIVACEFIPISIYGFFAQRDLASLTMTTITNAGFNLIGTAIFCVVVLCSRFIIFQIKPKNGQMVISKNFAVIIAPLVSILVLYYTLDSSQRFPVVDAQMTVQTISIYLGLLLMNVVIIVGDDSLKKRYQLQWEIDTLSSIEETDKIVIAQQDQYINELKGFEHDYNKQISGIRHLIKANGIGAEVENELEKYASEMALTIQEHYRFSCIPIPALRSILSQAQSRCSQEMINFIVDIQYADFSFVSFPDIYSLFENSIDNAIHACSLIEDSKIEKILSLQILRKRNLAFIEIKNSKTNKIIDLKGVIQSSKPDTEKHGFGLLSMKKAVQKYNGYSSITYTDTEFIVAITIPIPTDEQLR